MDWRGAVSVLGCFAAVGAFQEWANGCSFVGSVALGAVGWAGVMALLGLAASADSAEWLRRHERAAGWLGVAAFLLVMLGLIEVFDRVGARMCH